MVCLDKADLRSVCVFGHFGVFFVRRAFHVDYVFLVVYDSKNFIQKKL